MTAPFDSSSREAIPKKRSAPIKFLVPLIYAPVLPLIRIALRKNPVVRDRLFTAVLAGAFAHGFYLVFILYERFFFATLTEIPHTRAPEKDYLEPCSSGSCKLVRERVLWKCL